MADQIKRGRPYMRHYGIPSDEEGLLSWEWVDQQMAKSRNYWICSTRPDGRPHAAQVWGVWIDGVLYFSTDREARKARNLAANPEIVVHLESGDDAVILEGAVEVIDEREKLLQLGVGKAYALKYPPYDPFAADAPVGLWYALRPRTALAWEERDFTKSATRWDFDR